MCILGETSKLIGCSLHIHQPAAANLYRKCYTLLLDAAAFWLQPAVMNFDVFPWYEGLLGLTFNSGRGVMLKYLQEGHERKGNSFGKNVIISASILLRKARLGFKLTFSPDYLQCVLKGVLRIDITRARVFLRAPLHLSKKVK